jgi:hypothetical protein
MLRLRENLEPTSSEDVANGPKPPFTTISNAAVQSTEADIGALLQHY